MQIIDINTRFGSYPSRYKSTSADDLVADAQAHDVARVCALSTTGTFFYDQEGNAETLDAGLKHSGMLVPIGTLNPKTCIRPGSSVAEVVEGGFKAVRFFPLEQGWPIEFSPFAEILAELASAGIPAIVGCPKPGDVTALAKIVSGQGTKSGISVILESVTVDTFAEALSAMRTCSSLAVESHSIRFPDGLTLLRDNVGIERVVFGSGASAQSVGAALHYISESQLSDGDKEKVLGANASAILELA